MQFTTNPVRFIEIDTTRPDFQSIKAAQELLEQDYPIVFPGSAGYVLLLQHNEKKAQPFANVLGAAVNPPPTLFMSEDTDWQRFVNADCLTHGILELVNKSWPGPDTLSLPKAAQFAYPPSETIALKMPPATPNRAFHTLLQLCDFAVLGISLKDLGLSTTDGRDRIAALLPLVEYGFWELNQSFHLIHSPGQSSIDS